MRCLLIVTLLALALAPAIAEENEAEKLFRELEQKVRAAKTLRLRFDLGITDPRGKKGNARGSLILGEGDRYRAEAEGMLFGGAVKFTVVSDGASRKTVGAGGRPPKGKPDPSSKGNGTYFRGAIPREGFFFSSISMERRDPIPDRFKLSDFKLAGKEKIGERDTQVIQFTVKEKFEEDTLSVKLWLDVKTRLPAKLAITGGKTDIKDLTETYSEFTIDAKVEAKSFELPK